MRDGRGGLSDGRALRLAHRGDWRRAPENSLAAMLAALAIPNCDGLEFDVRHAADGTPILLHDETLERVQGRPERADELGVEALAAAGIPTLAEVLAAVPGTAFLDVELKGEAGDAVVPVLEAARGRQLHGAVVSSFEAAALERVASERPRWPRWLNAEDLSDATIRLARELGCSGISVEWTAIEEPAMARAAAVGLAIAAWTVRDRDTAARLERLGVVALCVEAEALDG